MFSTKKSQLGAVLATVALSVAVPAATAAAAPASAATTKPVKKPAFQAALHWSHEKATLASSAETFTTSGTRLPKGDRVVAWTASFGDSSTKLRGTTLPKSFTHTVKRDGKTYAQLSLLDAHGKHSTVTVGYVATGAYRGPNTTIGADGFHEVGEPVTDVINPGTWNRLSASVSVKFGDGTATTLKSPHGLAMTVPHVYSAVGTYIVTAIATDSRHAVKIKQTSVTVKASTAPQLLDISNRIVAGSLWYGSLTLASTSGPQTKSILDLSCSATNTAVTVTNVSAYDANLTATWTTLGNQTVSCSFLDPGGIARSASIVVDVVAPSFTLHDDLDTTSIYSTHGTAYATYDLGPRTVTAWTYDPGDGLAILSGTGPYVQQQFSRPYPSTGEFTDRLTLTLDDGEQLTDYGRVSIVVPATLSVGSYSTDGDTMTLENVATTKDARASWTTWSISWGDGTSTHGTGQIPTTDAHTYAADDDYDVSVRVDDDHGSVGYVDSTVTVP